MIIKINNYEYKCENDNNMIKLKKLNIYALCFWFYNPITIAISSRGNAESIMSFIVLILIYYLCKKSFILSGFLFAISIHFKIYPITYTFAIFLYILFNGKNEISFKQIFKFQSIARLIKFFLTLLLTFAAITIYFYYK